jgi:hypothetical protein
MYKEVFNKLNGAKANMVCRIADNAFIPFSEDNTDYAEYLKWLAEGGIPEAADSVPAE